MLRFLFLTAALLAPASVFAQDVGVSKDEARRITQRVAREFPEILVRLREEIQNGVSRVDLLCTNAAPLPCEEGSRAMTPGGVEVGLTIDGLMFPLIPEEAFRPEQPLLNRMISPGPREDAVMTRQQIREEGVFEEAEEDPEAAAGNVPILGGPPPMP